MPAPAETSDAAAAAPPVGDLRSQGRGVTAAGVGFAVQLALAVAAFVLAQVARSDVFAGVFAFAVGGLLVWGVTAVAALFRRSRSQEAYELEAAARSGESARTIFDSEADARPAARRLARLYSAGIPVVSAVVGVGLVLAGLYFLNNALRVRLPNVREPALVVGASAVAAFAGFVAGYYLTGLARGLTWPTLRGAATYLLGSVVLFGAVAVAVGLGVLGLGEAATTFARYAVPAAVAAVGVEILLNLVLDVYRPKAAAEAQGDPDAVSRPAFESRLIRLLVSPGGVVRSLNEAVNYQFGFEVTQSWFAKLLARSFAPLVLLGVAVLVLGSSVVVVGDHQRALVLTFGRLGDEPLRPGLHLKLPWPLARATVVDVTRVRQLVVGTHTAAHDHDVVTWDTQDDNIGPEDLLVVAPTDAGRADDDQPAVPTVPGAGPAESPSGVAGQDVALAAADLQVHYRVGPDNLGDYARGHADPVRRLAQMAETALSREMSRYDIDAAVGAARQRIAGDIAAALRRQVAQERLGLEVVYVGLTGVMPPREVAEQFNETVASGQDRLRLIQEGQTQAAALLAQAAGSEAEARELSAAIARLNAASAPGAGDADAEELARLAAEVERRLQAAGGSTARALSAARAQRYVTENDARARAERVPAYAEAWNSVRDYFVAREYLDVLREHMPASPKVVTLSDAPTHRNFTRPPTLGGALGDLGLEDAEGQ